MELKLQILEVRTPGDLDDAFRAATRERADALIVTSGAFTNFHQKRIAVLAINNRLPAVFNNVDAGFLMLCGQLSFVADLARQFRALGIPPDRIITEEFEFR